MRLDPSPDQIATRDEAARILAEKADSAAVRRAIGTGSFDSALWKIVAGELGWCAAAIAEEDGGLGLGVVELILIAEQVGRRLAPVPYWSTACVAAPIIATMASEDHRETLLRKIAKGSSAAVALSAPFVGDLMTISASRDGDGYALSGVAPAVHDLISAQIILVPTRLDDGTIALFALTPDAGVAVSPIVSLDLTRPVAALALEQVAAPASARIDRGGLRANDFAAPLRTAALGLAAEQVGAAQGCLDLTLAYIAERKQFGRSIASFQAIKHRCAELVVTIAEARSLVYGAAFGIGENSSDLDAEITAAGVLASEALFRVAAESIQLHGGAGNTWEYDPHLFLRRAQATAHLFGAIDDRIQSIADGILGEAA